MIHSTVDTPLTVDSPVSVSGERADLRGRPGLPFPTLAVCLLCNQDHHKIQAMSLQRSEVIWKLPDQTHRPESTYQTKLWWPRARTQTHVEVAMNMVRCSIMAQF